MSMLTVVNETKDPRSNAFQVIETGVTTEGNERSTLANTCVMTNLSNFLRAFCWRDITLSRPVMGRRL